MRALVKPRPGPGLELTDVPEPHAGPGEVADRVDLLTGTLGKALGGASGGSVSGPAEVIALLRQRSRPYLFSNAVAPVVAAGSLKAIEIARRSDEARDSLRRNTALFRELMTDAGFELLPGSHPLTPVMFPGDDGARPAPFVTRRGSGRRRRAGPPRRHPTRSRRPWSARCSPRRRRRRCRPGGRGPP